MKRNDVSSVRNFRSVRNGNGIRGRVGKSSSLLASGKHTSRYGGFSSNGNNNTIKHSARNVRGWVSESNVSSVRNGNGNNGTNNNKRSARNIGGWVSNEVSSMRNGKGIRGRVGKSSGLLASGASKRSSVSSVRNGNGIWGSRGWVRGRAEGSVRNGNCNNNKLSA